MKTQLSELRQLPEVLRQILNESDPRFWKTRPSGGGFCLIEQICHLRDLETEGYLLRIQRLLQEDCPELAEFDGTKIASERNYIAEDPAAALSAFQQSRSSFIALLSNLHPEQFQRKGRFGEFGIITIENLVEMMLEHDRSHREELDSLLKEWK
ncbi:DinB family protein [bacterium]|nr:DinB family protein [bacterium]